MIRTRLSPRLLGVLLSLAWMGCGRDAPRDRVPDDTDVPDTDTDGPDTDPVPPLEPVSVRMHGPAIQLGSEHAFSHHATVSVEPSGRWMVAYEYPEGARMSLYEGRKRLLDEHVIGQLSGWHPQMAWDGTSFLVVAASNKRVIARTYDRDGTLLAHAPVDDLTEGGAWAPDVGVLPGIGAFTAWSVQDDQDTTQSVRWRFYPTGMAADPPTTLAQPGLRPTATVAVDAAGTQFVLAWSSLMDEDADAGVIFARRYDGDEALGGPKELGSGIGRPALSTEADGHFAAAWIERDGVCALRFFDPRTRPTTEVLHPTHTPCRRMDLVGWGDVLLAAWDEGNPGGGDIWMQVLDRTDGTPRSAPIRAPTELQGTQMRPALALVDHGDGTAEGWVTWESTAPGDPHMHSYARRFTLSADER